MPIYEYSCNKCSHEFETLVIGDSAPECPECESQDLDRLMSRCGFVSKSAVPGGGVQTTTSSVSGCSSCSSSNCSSCGMG